MPKPNYCLDTKNIWFPEQREPIHNPSNEEDNARFNAYWRREKKRCIEGFDIADGQVHISGWLYWHTVYWKIAAYIEDPKSGRKTRKIITPWLRDIEWFVAEDFTGCEKEGHFYNVVGARDFGKSIVAGSKAGHSYTFYDNSESIISAGAENYVKLATDKVEDGLTNLHPIWKKKRLNSDWKKEVKAGWKDKHTNQPDPASSNSKILMRNYQEGNNSMVSVGARPGFHLIDEQGTILELIACLKDSEGAWWSGGGDKPSCLGMLAGTGGDMEVGMEAAEIFFNPDAYNMLAFDNPEQPGGKMGRFVDALLAKITYKEPKTLAEYLGINHPDLEKITILVSNKERAYNEWWLPAYTKAKKSGNPKAVTKFLAYQPLKPSDSFLVLTYNNYDVHAAEEQQKRLRLRAQELPLGFIGEPVELYNDGEGITHRFSKKLPITEFPWKTQDGDAPIMVYEFPIQNPPWGLYLAGIDPYRFDQAEYSDSLGVVYIYKRMHEIGGEKFQDMIVASFAARPSKHETWNEQARLLIKWYNALAFCENDEYSFIAYMIAKGDSRYLSPVPQWLKDQLPFSSAAANREYGVHSSVRAISFYRSEFKNYLGDVIYTEKDKEGSVIKEHTRVSTVQDIMLLEEVRKVAKKGNFDRERAASIVITAANKMAPFGAAQKADPIIEAMYSKKVIRGSRMFPNRTSNLFKKKTSNLFKR